MLLSLSLPFIFGGCMKPSGSTEKMTVHIRSCKNTNRGTPLYVIIKETTMVDFLIDDYNHIAAQSFWKEDNHGKLVKKILFPGKTDQIEVDIPNNDKSVGLYFIFTKPGECWKYYVDNPQSKKVKVLLGSDAYEAINVYES
jgi:hypothetical protein